MCFLEPPMHFNRKYQVLTWFIMILIQKYFKILMVKNSDMKILKVKKCNILNPISCDVLRDML